MKTADNYIISKSSTVFDETGTLFLVGEIFEEGQICVSLHETKTKKYVKTINLKDCYAIKANALS